MDLIELLNQHNIPNTTEHHHATAGHVQVHCPFCEDRNFHLGLRLDGQVGNCWRCGGHNGIAALAKLLRLPYREIEQLLSSVPKSKIRTPHRLIDDDFILPVHLPSGTGRMQARHRRYLIERNFDSDVLEADYGLLGTGPLGRCKLRIILPIIRHGTAISYTGRDITGRAAARYKTCPASDESFPAKSWLYDLDRCEGAERVLVVEGPIDAWRMGKGAVATFGIAWTWAQAELLSRFPTVFVMFDPEERADAQAEKLVEALSMLSVEAEIVSFPDGANDPGSLPDDEVKRLRRWLGL